MKIAIVTCYLGKFPLYFSFFLHSCSYNPTIDFLIFSDEGYLDKIPTNVTIIKKTLSELKVLINNLIFNLKIRFINYKESILISRMGFSYREGNTLN